jgi:hypothetical protein
MPENEQGHDWSRERPSDEGLSPRARLLIALIELRDLIRGRFAPGDE